MINAFIKGQTLKIVAPVIVSDSIKYLEAKFHFQTSDWDGFSKWAHFKNGAAVYEIRLNADDAITKSDNLNLGAGTWEVYLHGTSENGERVTTDTAKIEVKQSGVLDGEPFPDVPLSVVEQLDERISMLEEGTGGGSGVTDQRVGDLSELTTEDKTNLVRAINEVNANIGDIDAALDEIILIQEALIGGASE